MWAVFFILTKNLLQFKAHFVLVWIEQGEFE